MTERVLNEANFNTLVSQKDRVLVVDFWAEWCGPCKTLKPILVDIAEENGYDLGMVDTDSETSLATRFSITSIPTLMIFSDGVLKGTLYGALPKNKLLIAINEALGK